MKDGASASAAPTTVSGVGVAVRVAAGVVGVSVGDTVAAGVSVAVGSGVVGDSTVGEGEASVGVELIGAAVALAVSVLPGGAASVDVGTTSVGVEAGVPVASGGPAVAVGVAEETVEGSAVEEGGAGSLLGGAIVSVCVGPSNPATVAGRSSDGGEADVGTESRPAASTSHATTPARAKRRRWAIVFPPGSLPATSGVVGSPYRSYSTRAPDESQSPSAAGELFGCGEAGRAHLGTCPGRNGEGGASGAPPLKRRVSPPRLPSQKERHSGGERQDGQYDLAPRETQIHQGQEAKQQQVGRQQDRP